MSKVQIYAHRGASKHALENTWKAFELAHELQAGIELDIQLTRDGIGVVFHDANLKRLAGTKADISELPFEEVKSLAIRKRFKRFGNHRIPLAYEVLDWAKNKKIPMNVELKSSIMQHPQGPEIIAALLEEMELYHISSFDIELLGKMKHLLPDAELAWIIKKDHQWNELESYSWIDSIHFHKKFHQKKRLEPIAAMNKPIRLYGISGKEKFLQHLHPAVTGLITDYPMRFQSLP